MIESNEDTQVYKSNIPINKKIQHIEMNQHMFNKFKELSSSVSIDAIAYFNGYMVIVNNGLDDDVVKVNWEGRDEFQSRRQSKISRRRSF